MTSPKFFTGKWLTAYAMSCGYLHSHDAGNVKLYALSQGCGYEIYVSKNWTTVRPDVGYPNGEHERGFYLGFDSLPEARKAYKYICGELRQRWEANPEVARSVYC